MHLRDRFSALRSGCDTNWAKHSPPEDQVEISSGETELALGTKFHRVTVGYPMTSIVKEFVPGRRLGWVTTVDGDETGSTAYHGWVITPTEDVLTEETQQGDFWLELTGRKHPGGLFRYHQDWVEGLARTAEGPSKLDASPTHAGPCFIGLIPRVRLHILVE